MKESSSEVSFVNFTNNQYIKNNVPRVYKIQTSSFVDINS